MKQQFEQELEELKSNEILSPAYKRKKFIQYIIRTTIAIILYVIFWKYSWVRWSLIVYIPLNLFSLLAIFVGDLFLKKKIGAVEQTINEMDDISNEDGIETE